MAKVDAAWPSEDEDFDATSDNFDEATTIAPENSEAQARDNKTLADIEATEGEPIVTPDDSSLEADGEDTIESASPNDAAEASSSSSSEPSKIAVTIDNSESKPKTEEETPRAPEAPEEAEPEPEAAVSDEPSIPMPPTKPEALAPQPAAPRRSDRTPAPAVSPAKPAPKSRSARPLPWRLAVEALLVLIIVALSFWIHSLTQDKHDLQAKITAFNANPQATVEKQSQDIITKVGALMQLPQGETPTVANVSDAAAAKKQSAFFANAQNGDKVLMYAKAGEAILYRPSTNHIVLVAPLTFNQAGTTQTTK